MPACHPQQIGGYTIAGVIGQGGMGTVYRALPPDGERLVALKLLQPSEALRETLGLEALRALFRDEVRIMAGLAHPNIAEVLDWGEDEGRPFFTMEHYCTNLGLMIGEGEVIEKPSRRLPPDKVLGYAGQILSGLEHLHAGGIVHRDVKPANMLLTERGTIKICDFGMARHLAEGSVSAPGMRIGSPYYSAPEQISDPHAADRRADLYGAAALFYRLLTGELPAMKGFMLSRVNHLYDPAWDAFFARGLRWRPGERFQDAAEMAAALFRLALHWGETEEKVRPGRPLPYPLRTDPLTVSGDMAREIFAVDGLWQPSAPARAELKPMDADTLRDEATGLIWQRSRPGGPVDREGAAALVAALNAHRFAALDAWRLPTVNELLSLARTPGQPPDSGSALFAPPGSDWFWSCDRRSAATSWFVNPEAGYVGWQENRCRAGVRAVASASPGPGTAKAG